MTSKFILWVKWLIGQPKSWVYESKNIFIEFETGLKPVILSYLLSWSRKTCILGRINCWFWSHKTIFFKEKWKTSGTLWIDWPSCPFQKFGTYLSRNFLPALINFTQSLSFSNQVKNCLKNFVVKLSQEALIILYMLYLLYF